MLRLAALSIHSDSGQSLRLKVPINPLQSPNVSLDWQEPENIPYFRYNSLFYLLSPA